MRSRTVASIVTAIVVGVLAARHGSAAIIADYTFAGGSPASADAELNSTAADMVKPASTDWGFSSLTSTAFARSNATTNSQANAITAGDYFGFTVTPDSGFELDLTALRFDTTHNLTDGGSPNTSATIGFFVRSSLDGFTADIGPIYTQPWNTMTPRTVDLSGAAFQDIAVPAEFRMYVYDSGVDLSQNGGRYDNISLEGAVGPIGAPPPTSTSFQEGVSPTVAYTQDAVYIRQSQATTNQNSDPDRELILGFTGGAGDEMRGLLEFDVSAIPASDQIDSVSLILRTETPSTGQGGDITLNVYDYGFDIDEATATWNAPGAGDGVAGGTLGTLLASATFAATAGGIDVTFTDSLFNAALSDALEGDGFLRLLLARSDNSGSGNRFARFDDETVTTGGFRPELLVAHSAPLLIPEPATLSLL
ncbi:DNRLRE domain-containing protein, partial [bacterium]|nr:DNRLRE domain-containing protein [bacterium]